ncbi:MAG: phage portal protein [Eubacteriales bacterium]|nr:phage portal protein [Eubacteriales bacterium]
MSKRKGQKVRAPTQSRSISGLTWLCAPDTFSSLIGYTALADNPEVQTAVQRVADLVSSMSLHLKENTKDGDRRLENELSRKVDITPCKFTTRKGWVETIVRDMLLSGNSIHIPHYAGSLLDDIEPIPQRKFSITDLDYGYTVQIRGRTFQHDEILHFVHNPDPEHPWHGRGHRVSLQGIVNQISRARQTASKLMESPTPSIIVKVDGLTEEFASLEGRRKLSAQYLDSSENGQPWFIPAEAFSVEKVTPLNLDDLAIIDSINLDKRTVASIIGVPPFLVGVGDFDQDEYNAFVRFVVLPIARAIEQELTQKLIISPKWYFRFNPRSLYAYSFAETGEVICNLVDRAIVDRNEARDALEYDPREGLSELAVLENYIPYTKIGDQKKLDQTSQTKGDGK